ncbi:phosphate ABC transporter permease PstA [Halapricum hydrolyticum]|uniref:Phosphate transport system permease protein PstA n=1 Tax=Halapricum hydrolyticum TaxID=2979991 RepID=A0AAE3IC84_9EURY|nr:phosphate ABC transporter permease PstA [Halapricum hydrolyticum]MCU4716481.1 phosphate ABC transporter permease PstA [Halapricum hydrolyticum]MCU4725914.1 phosphate ABC transporter permease PstA [Halapricum hydrolyticum]
MATQSESTTFGRVNRIRGVVFENITRAAALVGVLALFVLLVYTALDAFQPFTAEREWYVLLLGTFGIPALLVGSYCWSNRTVGRVAIRAVGLALGTLALTTVLVLWLGGQLALLVVVASVFPTGAYLAYLLTHRRELSVGLQFVGIIVSGGGIASIVSFFLGTQATLVYAITVGIPSALLALFFLRNPAVGSLGVRATAAAITGTGIAALGLEVASIVLGMTVESSLGIPGESTAVGVYALGAVLGTGVYGAIAVRRRVPGLLGLFAPFVLLAGALAGFWFHREYVIVSGVVPALYGVTVVLPALAYVLDVFRTRSEGGRGLALPVVFALGLVIALQMHERFVLLVPAVELVFGLTTAGAIGTYGWWLSDRDRSGTSGVAVPVILGGGLLAGVVLGRRLGISGPDTWLTVDFLTNGSHYEPGLAGIHPALIGSLYLMVIVTFVSFPVGVGAAIYLEEYAGESRLKRFLEINISNLAGVPSVVYGLLGVGVFIRYGGLRLGAVVAGGFTLALLILPIVIISAQEAIKAVPDSLRQASYGMGATRWQTIRNVVLPRALPGILTGTILALGRAIGETAPLIMVGLAAIGGVPDSLLDQGTAMPLQVFSWALDAKELFRENVAAAGSMTLLIALLSLNATAIVIRNRYQREQ